MACQKNDSDDLSNQNFYGLYGGRPYRGAAKAVINAPTVDRDVVLDGDGRIALMDSSGDSVSIVFMADFGQQGEVNLKLRGKINGADFHMGDSDRQNFFNVRGEAMDGKVINAIHEMAFSGKMRRDQTSMRCEVNFKEADGIFPKGSTLHLTFETSRKIPSSSDEGTGCQTRVVPIWGPNGMSMGIVPDC